RYHCSSSHALDETLKAYREMALAQLTSTANRMIHEIFLPMNWLIRSISRDNASRSATTVPLPMVQGLQHAACRLRNAPSGTLKRRAAFHPHRNWNGVTNCRAGQPHSDDGGSTFRLLPPS